MTLSLPIPGRKEKFEFFYIPYNMENPEYSNFKVEISSRETDTIYKFRNDIKKKLNMPESEEFIISIVGDN